jgi:exopolyphosphatase / guanosine-5'-triphosphate,3'-diphosphate pyrophosphatase
VSHASFAVCAQHIAVSVDDGAHRIPVGIDQIGRELSSDPPRPEELINAIGLVVDHLDDLARELPDVIGTAVLLSGPPMEAIACVEVGAAASWPFVLTRDAAEDVFRTLATERHTERRRNPGLDPAHVETIVAGCCILVAIMRRLHLDELTISPLGAGQ